MVKIFGREPAMWLMLASVLVKMAAAFGVHMSADQQALINAAAAAAVAIAVAVIVHDGLGAAVVGGAQAALALAVGFGLHWSADRQAVTMSLVAVVVGMWTRTQVTAPVAAPAPRSGADVYGG